MHTALHLLKLTKLKVFESNDEPHSYAAATQFKGTSTASHSTVVAAIGSNYHTSMHVFKSEFRDHTGMDWDARISHHIKRIREEKLARGSAAPGSTRGVPVSDSDSDPRAVFAAKKFEYHPPAYGPKGEIADAEIARCQELGVTLTHANAEKSAMAMAMRTAAASPAPETAESSTREAIESWLGDEDFATGDAQKRVDSPQQPATQDPEFDALLNGEDYPFEKPLDNVSWEIEQSANLLSDLDANAQCINGANDAQQPALISGIDEAIGGEGETDRDQQTGSGDYDWGFNTDMLNSSAWFDNEIAQLQSQNHDQYQNANDNTNKNDNDKSIVGAEHTNDPQHASMDAQIPSFTTYPTVTDTNSFQHGTQNISETQVADKAGGEFLEEFANPQQATPPPSAQKDAVAATEKPKGLFGGLNLGSSILGKRKANAEDGGKEKVAGTGEA